MTDRGQGQIQKPRIMFANRQARRGRHREKLSRKESAHTEVKRVISYIHRDTELGDWNGNKQWRLRKADEEG